MSGDIVASWRIQDRPRHEARLVCSGQTAVYRRKSDGRMRNRSVGAGDHAIARRGRARRDPDGKCVVLRVGAAEGSGMPGERGHAAGPQPPSSVQRPGMWRSSRAARAAGMMKPPISRMTVRRSGSSISSGSRARNDRHCWSFWESSEKARVKGGGRSRGMAVARLSKVGCIAAVRVIPSNEKSRDIGRRS